MGKLHRTETQDHHEQYLRCSSGSCVQGMGSWHLAKKHAGVKILPVCLLAEQYTVGGCARAITQSFYNRKH